MGAHATTPPPTRSLAALALLWALAALPPAHAQPRSAANLSAAGTGNLYEEGARPGSWVHPATGELYFVEKPDLVLGGPMPLGFQRYYAQLLSSDGFATSRIGTNWLGTFDWKLTVAGMNATVVTHRGRVIRFTSPSPGTWQLVSPQDNVYQLAAIGPEYKLLDPSARRIFVFDLAGRLVRVEDGRGNSHTLTYAGALLTQVEDSFGRRLTFTYDPLDRLESVSDGARTVSFGHAGDKLTTFTNAAGQTTTYNEVMPGLPMYALGSVELPAGNEPWTFAFNPVLEVASCTDVAARGWTYSRASGVTTLTDPNGGARTYEYDPALRVFRRTDPLGNETSYGYDAAGRLASVTRPAGDVTSVLYHPATGYPSSIVLPGGAMVQFGYTPRAAGGLTFYDLTSLTYPDGATETFTYDAAGNPIAFTDRSGRSWSMTWTAFGRLATLTNPAGGTTQLTYDVRGRAMVLIDAAGVSTQFAYDAMDRLTTVIRPDLSEITLAYEPLNHITNVTDEVGAVWMFDYNANGLLQKVTDPFGTETLVSYTGMDWRMAVTYTDGTQVTLGYDSLIRPHTLSDRTGRTTAHTYDAASRLTRLADPDGHEWVSTYDTNGRPITCADPLGNVHSFLWDARDRLTQVTDPVSSVEQFTYDAMDRLISADGPLGYDRGFHYDPRSLLEALDETAFHVEMPRNDLGQASSVVDANARTWSAQYDGAGRRTRLTDPLGGVTTFGYDGRGRLASVVSPAGSLTLVYDAASRILQRAYSDGLTSGYTYDAAGRLLTAGTASFAYDLWGRMTESNGMTSGRDPAGRISSVTYAPGRVAFYTYDSRGLLQQIQDVLGGIFTFAYDDGGRLVRLTRPNGVRTEYQYDAAGRIIRLIERTPIDILSSTTLTRDARGQVALADRQVPLHPPVVVASRSFSYDEASQIVGYDYDALGRLVDNDGPGPNHVQYNLASDVLTFYQEVAGASFTYDGLGLPTSRTEGPITRQWVWNYALRLPSLSIVREGGPDRSYFLYTPGGELLARYDAVPGPCCSVRYYHFDESGNTIFLTDAAATIVTQYAYTPYGEPTEALPDPDNLFTFGGQLGVIREGATGLYRMRDRIYDSKTARFVAGRGAWPTSNTLESLDFAPGPMTFQGRPVDSDGIEAQFLGSSLDPATDRHDPYKNFRSVSPFQYRLQNPVDYVCAPADACAGGEAGMSGELSDAGRGFFHPDAFIPLGPVEDRFRFFPVPDRDRRIKLVATARDTRGNTGSVVVTEPIPDDDPRLHVDLQQARHSEDAQQGRVSLDWVSFEGLIAPDASITGPILPDPAPFHLESYEALTNAKIAGNGGPLPVNRVPFRYDYFKMSPIGTASDGTAGVTFTPSQAGKARIEVKSDSKSPRIDIKVKN